MGFNKLFAYLGDNAAAIDPAEYETKLRDSDPRLLQHDERIILAFKGRGGKGRDHELFTNKRILRRDKRGTTGKRIRYTSVPYKSIRAFSVETTGTVDSDSELKIYARGIGEVSMDFVCDVDILAIHRFLSEAVIKGEGAGMESSSAVVHDSSVNMNGSTGFFDMVGDNYSQVDETEIESKLKGYVLMQDEKVELGFRCSRDLFVMTNERVLKIDVQGVTGKKVEYLTIFWPAIKGFSVETAGNIMDRDSELTLYFNLPSTPCVLEGFPRNSRTRLCIDFRDGKADLFAVQKYVSDKLLGVDTVSVSKYGSGMAGQAVAGSGSFLAWLGDDNSMIDPIQADRMFHADTPILQKCETVELAFKGRRDMILFTGKRVVFVDVQGFMGMGKKVEYISVPWTTVSAFSVRSAGSWVDKDSEMCLWLDFDDIFNPRRESEDTPPPPPIPRRSWIEIDFQKDNVDVLMIHRYLSERCMRTNHSLKPFNSPVSMDVLTPLPPDTSTNLFDWIGDNASAIDANSADEKFHECGLLQDDEHVGFAFKSGRDSMYLTTKRIFVIDVQGVTGKRKEYMSVPLDNVRSWAVESAGNFDRDMEFKAYFRGYWNNKVEQDLRKGKADIVAIQSFIAHFVIGSADGTAALKDTQTVQAPGSMDKFLGYLSNNAYMEDPVAMTDTLRTSPAFLQADESVEAAFKCGRDTLLVTSKRVVIIDKKGISGKSIEYTSYPLMYNTAFWVETEGHLMDGSEVQIYTDDENIHQEFARGQNDNIWTINELLSTKMLDEYHPGIGEDEIELNS